MLEAKPHVSFEVERVIGISSDGTYQVQWAPAWVSRVHLIGCEHLIQEYLQRQHVKSGYETQRQRQPGWTRAEAERLRAEAEAYAERQRTEEEANGERVTAGTKTIPESFRTELETPSGLLSELSALSEHSQQSEIVSDSPLITHNEDQCPGSKKVVQPVNSQDSRSSDCVGGIDAVDEQMCSLNSFVKTCITTSEWRNGKLQEPIFTQSDETTRILHHQHSTATQHASDSSSIGIWNKFQNNLRSDSSPMYIKKEEEDELVHNASPQNPTVSCNPPLSSDMNEYTDEPIAEDEIDTSTYLSEESSLSSMRYNRNNNAQSFGTHTDLPVDTSHKHFQTTFKNVNTNDHIIRTESSRTDEEQQSCVTCRKSFLRKGNLEKHVCSATVDGKPHACSHCSSKFSSSKDLRRHLRMHTGEKPFQCDICGRAFTRKDNLNTHKRVHVAYTCDWCGESFMRESTLRQHRLACPLKTISFIQMP